LNLSEISIIFMMLALNRIYLFYTDSLIFLLEYRPCGPEAGPGFFYYFFAGGFL